MKTRKPSRKENSPLGLLQCKKHFLSYIMLESLRNHHQKRNKTLSLKWFLNSETLLSKKPFFHIIEGRIFFTPFWKLFYCWSRERKEPFTIGLRWFFFISWTKTFFLSFWDASRSPLLVSCEIVKKMRHVFCTLMITPFRRNNSFRNLPIAGNHSETGQGMRKAKWRETIKAGEVSRYLKFYWVYFCQFLRNSKN